MNIDHVGCGINPHAPNMIQDHCASYDAAGISAEIFEKRKFLRSQLKQLIAASSLMTHQIKLQVCGLQPYRFILRRWKTCAVDFSTWRAVPPGRMAS